MAYCPISLDSHHSLTMIYSVIHLFHLEALKAERSLRQGVEAIEAEEEKHCKLTVLPLLASRIDDSSATTEDTGFHRKVVVVCRNSPRPWSRLIGVVRTFLARCAFR